MKAESLWGRVGAFTLLHFHYCSDVWHFCGAQNTEKLEALNKHILRFILKDYSSPCKQLLEKANLTLLSDRRLQTMVLTILLYSPDKSVFLSEYPNYMKQMCSLYSISYDLREASFSHCPNLGLQPMGKTLFLNTSLQNC